MDQHFHVAGVRRVAVEDFRGNEAAASFFGNQGIVGVEKPTPVFLIREEHVPQALCFGLCFQFLDDGQHHPAVFLRHQFLMVLLFKREDFFLHESFDALEIVLALLGNTEIHCHVLLV